MKTKPLKIVWDRIELYREGTHSRGGSDQQNWGLAHKDLLGMVTIEKNIANINLTNGQMRWHRNREDKSNGGGSNHETRSIKVINTFNFTKSLSHQTGLVAFDRTIGLLFDLVDPFKSNNLLIGARRNQGSCVVESKSIHFNRHSITPFEFGVSLSEGGRLGFKRGDN